jgi:hypothetical protein
VGGLACGGAPPPPPPAPTVPVAAPAKETPPDLSAVAEPPNLVVVGRIAKPDAILSTLGSWTKLPIPVGAELLRSLSEDDALADVVDLGKPVDLAVTVTLSRHGLDPRVAFSVAVRSFDRAKALLGAKHRLEPGSNGELRVVGIGGGAGRDGRSKQAEDEDEDQDDDVGCVLAHTPPVAGDGRLVCGEPAAVSALSPYLARTLSRETWPSDIHVELRPEPLRAAVGTLRAMMPMAGQALGASGSAARDLLDAGIAELIDLVGDTQRLAFDANLGDSGAALESRFEFRSQSSTFAKMVTANDRADAPPAAFWHLPAETDTAFFGRGSDPKLFDHARELFASFLAEGAAAGAMPEAERKAVTELVRDRLLPLFTTGSGIYAKGYDAAGVDKALKTRQSVSPTDVPGVSEAKRIMTEQAFGWHLYQTSEPIARVAPALRDIAAIWNRPAFAVWIKSKAKDVALPKMRLAPAPAGVKLPKDSVHVEVTIPRDDVDLDPPISVRQGPKPKPPPVPAKYHRKPVMLHVFAIPDGGATWLAFGMDGKLAATKALASLSTAETAGTLGASPAGKEALREGKMTSGGFLTLRGLAVFTTVDSFEGRAPYPLLATLPGKGGVPILFTGKPEAPSDKARGGVSTGSVRVPRAFIEDAVKLVMTMR